MEKVISVLLVFWANWFMKISIKSDILFFGIISSALYFVIDTQMNRMQVLWLLRML